MRIRRGIVSVADLLVLVWLFLSVLVLMLMLVLVLVLVLLLLALVLALLLMLVLGSLMPLSSWSPFWMGTLRARTLTPPRTHTGLM